MDDRTLSQRIREDTRTNRIDPNGDKSYNWRQQYLSVFRVAFDVPKAKALLRTPHAKSTRIAVFLALIPSPASIANAFT